MRAVIAGASKHRKQAALTALRRDIKRTHDGTGLKSRVQVANLRPDAGGRDFDSRGVPRTEGRNKGKSEIGEKRRSKAMPLRK